MFVLRCLHHVSINAVFVWIMPHTMFILSLHMHEADSLLQMSKPYADAELRALDMVITRHSLHTWYYGMSHSCQACAQTS